MSGFVLHVGATVTCSEVTGQATPQASNPRVRVAGQNTILLGTPYFVSGCPRNSPCTAGTWIQGASRVKSLGQPLVLANSQSTSVPNGSPLKVFALQTRVRGV